ncbi:MAG: LysR family transcriptional regulator [Rhodothermaceae bacterium]|nr:LysR family transcriptional regulator [Rhodothermaceae bacterium]
MNYTIHQLQIFLKVVETRSITRAAEAMYISQPAASVQLKKFQDQFDIPLTEVIGRQLYVTDFGSEIAVLAERVIQELNNINYRTRAYKGLLAGRLVVSSVSTGKYVIPYFLSGFLEKNPGIDLVLDVTNKRKVVDSLKDNLIDFALVSVLPDRLEVEEELLLENKLYLVGREPEWDKEKPLIYREEGSATRMAMELYFQKHSSNRRKGIELTSNEAVKQAVISNIGISLIPLIGIQNELMNKQLYILPAHDLPVITRWRIIWLKGKMLSPVATAFLAYVRENKLLLLDTHFKWFLEYA